ncbi:autophagy-related protein 9A-like [Littorina saxatilis]|uniref:Autophagy-related protein 9 n=1 Tax=Littorina saxatilis TaxID=31220 RepID=A0AAN9BRJ3_9CAEN
MAQYDTNIETVYQPLGSYDEDEETDENELPVNEQDLLIHVCPENSKGNWNHIEDLDDFFTRVYNYHQRGGYICMTMEDVFQLVQFLFIAVFAYFMSHCVSYTVLFHDIEYNKSHKVTLDEAILPMDQCIDGLGSSFMVILTIIFLIVVLIRLAKVIFNISKYLYIRSFYVNALKIPTGELANMTWHEVQTRVLEVQKEHQMCVHKRELTQLDIYHRILRFKNYMVAMANVNTIPLKHDLPLLGKYAYVSIALKFNLDAILFWGPWAPFENNWHLRNEYKSARNKAKLTRQLESRIFWFGLANLVFCPLIFFWNGLYFFFRYAELIKRQPSIFGSRRWSNYSRLYLRHFNELDHEFNARLNKGYQPVSDYLNIFTSNIAVVIARNVMFFAGSVLAVLVILTVVDEDVLNVEHVLTIITVLGVLMTVCKGLIPDEHTVHSPELLLRNVAMAIHYMPENWAGNAHTINVRNAFSTLFQFKIVYIVEELLSPIITPFILLLCVRPRAANIVDFLRQFTVEVVGVGDICSFAQMDVRRHGNAKWQLGGGENAPTPAPPKSQQAENGKTEMSLMHFQMTNPEWKPDSDGNTFINTLRSQIQRDISRSMMMTTDGQHSLVSPSLALPSLVPPLPVGPYTSMMSSLQGPLFTPTSGPIPSLRLRGAVSQLEGPPVRAVSSSLLGSVQSSMDSGGMLGDGASMQTSLSRHAVRQVDECTRELMSNEMNINALYMHELRWRRGNSAYLSTDDYARAVWQSPEGSTAGSTLGSAYGITTAHSTSTLPALGQGHEVMPEIQEEGSADDEREVDTSMMSPPSLHHTDSAPL